LSGNLHVEKAKLKVFRKKATSRAVCECVIFTNKTYNYDWWLHRQTKM